MVIEGYLWENLVVTKDNIANAYLSLGQKAQALLQGRDKERAIEKAWIFTLNENV